jgi:competence protein ComEC
MIRWIPYTFVRTVLFFIAGIVLGLYAPGLISAGCGIALAVLLSLLYFLVTFFRFHVNHFPNPGWIALPLVLLLGYIHLTWQTESRDPDHLVNHTQPVSWYQAVITRFPEEKAGSWKIEARVVKVYSQAWQRKEGKILLYFSKADFPAPFQYGDVLLIKGYPQEVQGPGNPAEFDYKTFLGFRNIYHQHFVRGGEVIKAGFQPPDRFLAFAFQGRKWAEATLKRFVEGQRQQAIALALVLGITDGLDNELLSAYAASGAMHILAVSGLHVSILYFILLSVLSPLKKVPGGRWLIAFSSLLILWIYAFVTGLSPSVLRAVTMFSFFALAKPLARTTNVYNTLAVSAFCLLLFDPFLIRSVGFQLSYLAVLGIVYLYPRILPLWEPRQRIWAEVWKISAVSIAAQIATFSLAFLYFHQFPNYFLLSNLFVVPLSFAVLILGLSVLALSFVSIIAAVVGFCMAIVIRVLNYIVFTLESLPFSLVEDVYITTPQCLLMIAFILVMIALARYRKFEYVIMASVISVIYASLQWLHFVREVNVSKIIVYKIPGHSVIDLLDRGHTFFLSDSVMQNDLQKIRYHVQPNRLQANVRKVTTRLPGAYPLGGCTLIAWKGQTILQITGNDFSLPGPLSVDWLIIGNNALPEIDELPENLLFSKVILDSSNSFFFASRFLEAAKLFKLDVHSVLHHGAFISIIENRNT